MQKPIFNRTPLAAAVAVALGATTFSPLVVAQDTQDEEVIEEIVTTGIRGSLQRSMDIKRGEKGVVDAISAEDIGKFPDANLAESLQRVTGVSIDRSALGEGSQVTVRGFGPEYNLVTVNGRQMPTHNGTNRSFDFADLASEGVAGVQVYKTGRADVPSGGVGSTINISTPQPLSAEPSASFAVKALADTSTRTGDDIAPGFSGIYIDQFLDDTVGIAITASHGTRDTGVNAASTGGWYTNQGDNSDGEENRVINNENQINRPQGADESLSIPQSMAYNIAEYSTERTNAQLVLQWAPTEDITATVDYIRSEFELERSYSDLSAWFSNTAALSQSSAWTAECSKPGCVGSPIYYSEVVNNADFAMGTGEDGRKNLNESVGFNLEWWVNDRFRLEFDYHDSSAETGANNPNGTSSLITMASFNKVGQTILTGYELPVMILDLNSGGEANRPLYKDDMIITGSVFDNDLSYMELEQAKIAGSFEFFEASSIDFGVQTTEVSNRSAASNVQLDNWGGITEPGEISDVIVRSSIAGQFNELSGHNHPDLQTEFFTASLADLQTAGEAWYAHTGTEYAETGDCGTGYCADFTNWNLNDYRTTEETTAAYLQFNWSGDIGGMPANAHLGVRYEETDITSAARDTVYDGSSWVNAGNELNIVEATDADGNVLQSFTDVEGNYDVTLPSFDFDIEPWENIVLRFSASETITRPSYNDIKGGLAPNSTQYFPTTKPQASAGNPNLVPIQSFNIDLSFEWYYAPGSYFSVGYFNKEVDDFIGTGRTEGTTFEIPNIVGGDLWNRAVAESGIDPSQYVTLGNWILDNFQDDPLVDGQTILSSPNDPSIVFDLTQPINQDDAQVDGIELNLQHQFGDSPYGFVVNATFADADVAFDLFNPYDDQFVLNGLSDSANLIAYYDTEDLQVRLAYNWRDDFLQGQGQGQGLLSNPTFVKDFGQLDLNVTYYLNDNLTFYFTGLNLTNETYHVYGLSERQVLQAVQTGPRYEFAVRYNFDY